MPLASPDVLDSFVLGGAKLQAAAPEELREGVTSAFRFFFFRSGNPIVQPGRVIPKPITLHFLLNGPSALDTMQFLKRMAMQQKQIPFTWADKFNFNGYLTEFEGTYRQKSVTGSLTYQPMQDLANKDAIPGALNQTPAQRTADLVAATGQVSTSVGGITGLLANIEGVISTDLSPVFTFLSSAQDVVSQINDALSAYYDVTSIPYEIISQFAELANSAIGQIPAAIAAITNQITSPTTPLLEGTPDYLVIAWGQQTLSQLDDSSVALSLIMQSLTPAQLTYAVAEGDTIEGIVTIFGVTVAAFLSVNPGVNDSTLSVGLQVVIPGA